MAINVGLPNLVAGRWFQTICRQKALLLMACDCQMVKISLLQALRAKGPHRQACDCFCIVLKESQQSSQPHGLGTHVLSFGHSASRRDRIQWQLKARNQTSASGMSQQQKHCSAWANAVVRKACLHWDLHSPHHKSTSTHSQLEHGDN